MELMALLGFGAPLIIVPLIMLAYVAYKLVGFIASKTWDAFYFLNKERIDSWIDLRNAAIERRIGEKCSRRYDKTIKKELARRGL